MDTKDWVLLIKNQTQGPYTRAEIEQLLSSGEARYSDYIWRSGLKKWKLIRDIVNTNWGTEAVTVDDPQPQKAYDFTSEIVFQPRSEPHFEFLEDTPPEALTDNLTYSPLAELADEIVWDSDIEKIVPLKKHVPLRTSSRLLHLSQSFGLAIRNTEKSFLLGWFFVISGLLLLLAFIF